MNPFKNIKFRHWALIGFILGIMWLFGRCTTPRPRPAEQPHLVARIVDSLSLQEQAELPAYLVPAPAGSTKKQKRQWQNAQVKNLASAGHAPAKMKIKGSTIATGTNSTAVSTAKHTAAAVGTGATSTQVAPAKAPVATGNGRAQDFTKAAEKGGALATEPGATAGATTRTGIPPWALVAGLLLLLLIVLAVVAYHFRKKLAGWLKISV